MEVVRGPATLMYGSAAIGGAVNVLDSRIPTSLPDNLLTGSVDFGIGSVAKESAAPSRWAANSVPSPGTAMPRSYARDYKIPGFARNPPEPGDEEGKVPNSGVASDGASGGLSYVGADGYLGVAYSGWNSVYGSPAEEEVKLDMKQRRVDVQGEITTPFAFLRGAKLRWGHNDYRHFEIEEGEIGTRFNDKGWEGRLELPHQPLGSLSGAFGVQLRHRDLEAIGEERFIPPTKTNSQAVFLFEELPLGPRLPSESGRALRAPEHGFGRRGRAGTDLQRVFRLRRIRLDADDGLVHRRLRRANDQDPERPGALRRRPAHRDQRLRDRRPDPLQRNRDRRGLHHPESGGAGDRKRVVLLQQLRPLHL